MFTNQQPCHTHDQTVFVKLSDDRAALLVEGSVNFKNVVRLRQAGKELLAQQTTAVVAVDLAKVKNSDNAGLVLLIAWMGDAKHVKKNLVFQHVPDFLQRMAQVFGLQSILFQQTG